MRKNPFLDEEREFGGGIDPNEAYKRFLAAQEKANKPKPEPRKSPPPLQEGLGGLVIGTQNRILMYDFTTKKLETITELGNDIQTHFPISLAYYDDDLWILSKSSHLQSLKGANIPEYYKNMDIMSLLAYKGHLLLAGSPGIFEDKGSGPYSYHTWVGRETLFMAEVLTVIRIIPHNDNFLIYATRAYEKSNALYELELWPNRRYAELKGLYAETKGTPLPSMLEDMVSVHGHVIVANPQEHYLTCIGRGLLDPVSLTSTKINGFYRALAFDPGKDVLYASTNDGWIQSFSIKLLPEGVPWPTPTDEKFIIGYFNSGYSMLPVSETQKESLKRLGGSGP